MNKNTKLFIGLAIGVAIYEYRLWRIRDRLALVGEIASVLIEESWQAEVDTEFEIIVENLEDEGM